MTLAKGVCAIALALAGLVGGCAGVRPREGFPQVSNTVEKRLGYELTWHDGSDADRQADEKVAELLRQPLTAESAVKIALLNNRRLQATYEELGIAQADLVEAGLLRNPIFDAAYRFGNAGTAAKIDLGLTFDFVDVIFLHARRQLAEAELEATKARVTGEVLRVIGQTRSAFYAAQASEQAVASAKAQADAAEASADFARRLREAGNVRAIRLLVEQAAQAEAKMRLTQAEQDVADAREQLNRQIGASGGQIKWTLAGQLGEPTEAEPDAKETESLAVSNSLALAEERARITASLKTLGIAQPLGILSQLETGINAEREDGTWFTGTSIALPVPLFSQGQPQAAKAAARVRQARATLAATTVDVQSAARQTLARLKLLRQQIDATKQTLLPLRQSIIKESMLQYNAMQIGVFDLLNAKRDQLLAEASYQQLLRDYWQTKSDLDLIRAGFVPEMQSSSSQFDSIARASTVQTHN